jgi:hypothetical protein
MGVKAVNESNQSINQSKCLAAEEQKSSEQQQNIVTNKQHKHSDISERNPFDTPPLPCDGTRIERVNSSKEETRDALQ